MHRHLLMLKLVVVLKISLSNIRLKNEKVGECFMFKKEQQDFKKWFNMTFLKQKTKSRSSRLSLNTSVR